MGKRSHYEIQKGIVLLLREKPLSYTKLQTKLGTNYDTIKNHLDELETLDIIKKIVQQEHPENGQPSTIAELTPRGQEAAKRMESKRTKQQ